MADFERFIPPLVFAHLSETESAYLSGVFDRFHGYPSLQDLWRLMDEAWQQLGCNPLEADERFTSFYNHPVWLLNGLFVEQDLSSVTNRRAFTDWVITNRPKRLADVGGGFGCLARMIGDALPHAQVEVVEPNPHPAAVALAGNTPNVRYAQELSGNYDLLICIDVFEHVPDPLGLAAATANYLSVGGTYFMANCFAPVIKCHLPQLSHLQIGWEEAMRAMGLAPRQRVLYGRAYERQGDCHLAEARSAAIVAQAVYPWVCRLPKARLTVGRKLVRVLSALTAH